MNTTPTKNVVVRYPPSPTGFMHIGTLRTLLYNYLFAKRHNGKIILRIEDTDQARKVDGALESLQEMIAWAGIPYDEGPVFQSQRVHDGVYQQYAKKLLANNHAYYCFCTPERLDEMRKQQQKNKQPPMYDRKCCALTEDVIAKNLAEGVPHVIRLKVPRGEELTIHDVIRGDIVIHTDTVDDQVLIKSDGFPTYHLASVVDDHEMGITHVIRGEEWVTSTPKHLLLYRAFGWDAPVFAHLPLLLNADGKKKLSKRQGDVAVEDFINKGYLKDAIINFVALLGWNPGGGSTQEIFSMEELMEKFRLKKVHTSGAVVDMKRLNWMNAQYIKKMSIAELYDVARPFFHKNYPEVSDTALIKRVLCVEQDRLERLDQVGKENPFFFDDVAPTKELLRWKDNTDEETTQALVKAKDVLEKIDTDLWTRQHLTKILMDTAGDKRGDFLWPLRAALTGTERSPGPMDCAWVLGKDKTLSRIQYAIDVMA